MASLAQPIIQRVLLATDFSERSHAAQSYALDVAAKFEAILVLVHAIEPILGTVEGNEPEDEFDGFYEQLIAQANQKMEQIERKARQRNVATACTVEIGRRWRVVLDVAEEENVDLIVIGRRCYSDASEFSLGTTSQKVYFISSRPVLMVPCDRPAVAS